MAEPVAEELPTIKWCEQHWADLMFALKDRGLEEHINGTDEELAEALSKGFSDPCFDATNLLTITALETFGIEKLIGTYNGCPICGFADIISHVADIVATNHREKTH